MNKENYFAHLRKNAQGEMLTQTVREHCINTGNIAAKSVESIGLGYTSKLAGYLHDMGKCKQEFQEYLQKVYEGEKVKKGSVIHTFVGVKYILEKYHRKEDEYETAADITAEIIAYAIGAHHGLFDIVGSSDKNGFIHRMSEEGIHYEESIMNFKELCVSETEIDKLMQQATQEVETLINKIHTTINDVSIDDDTYNEIVSFCMGALERLVLSAVIEGDRTDTSNFMSDKIKHEYEEVDWESCLNRVEEKINTLPQKNPIDVARRRISDMCKKYASQPKGIIRLNIPTGGGKTLSSLRYSLAHALNYNMNRIILVSPLLSILEQNAKIVKEYVGNDDMILEHHSNVVNDENSLDENAEREILMESWESPIIITTLVQFLNTLFSGKTSSIRRFHSLINSVIVIDEVQTVPIKMLSLFNLAISFLSEICGATVVLCSATQPKLTGIKYSLKNKFSDMIPYNEEIWSVFKRTEIVSGGRCKLDEVPHYIEELLKEKSSLLIVCNKKIEAEQIYHGIAKKVKKCFHLSASMCTEHRRDALQNLYIELKKADKKNPVVCVSTQVIEAGVDISFETVIRLMTGMDSVVQSAGRCNRNAENEDCTPVYILNIMDEKLDKLLDIKRGKDATLELLEEFKTNPERFNSDLTSDVAIEKYYDTLYKQLSQGAMNFYVRERNCSLLDLLSRNNKYSDNPSECFYFRQAFKTAGELFKCFDDESIDVIVPYKEGKDVIRQLQECENWEYDRKKELLQKAKSFSVSIYKYQQKKLEEEKGLQWIGGREIAFLSEEYYNNITGFCINKQEMKFLEV